DGDAFKGSLAELIATGMFTDWASPTPFTTNPEATMYLVQAATTDSKTIEGAPAGTPWPGVFLYAGVPGQLPWVPTIADQNQWKAAGVGGVASLTWEQWLKICPGNKWTH